MIFFLSVLCLRYYNVNQLFLISEKVYRGLQETHCHENLSPKTRFFVWLLYNTKFTHEN